MEERMHFLIRLKDGESMASLCREFGISRKTGYKSFERFEECGLEGLSDRSRRPFRYANQLPEPVEAAIVAARREKPTWGARKIRERLLRSLPHAVKIPAVSTIHAVLGRHGLVTRPRRTRTRAEGTPLSAGLAPNDLWCTGYKGEFRLGNQCDCYPLTVTDYASRYLSSARPWNPTPKSPLSAPSNSSSGSAPSPWPSARTTASFSPPPTACRLGRENFAAPQQPLRAQSVTHLLGTICSPCPRTGQKAFGRAAGI
jgi:transposase